MYQHSAEPILAKQFEQTGINYPKKRMQKKNKKVTYYPESDGQPMAENTIHYNLIVKIKENLEILYSNHSNVFIAGDLFWYPVENNVKKRFAPDVMVVIGRPKGERGSYLQWKEDNIAPQVVIEIRSPGNTDKNLKKKFNFYQRYGVNEYYLYDYQKNKLEVNIRHKDKLKKLPDSDNKIWISPELGIRFELTDTLNLFYPDGRKFVSTLELENLRLLSEQKFEKEKQRAEKEKQRAEKEKQRAEKERKLREEEKLRADALAEKIKALELQLNQ